MKARLVRLSASIEIATVDIRNSIQIVRRRTCARDDGAAPATPRLSTR